MQRLNLSPLPCTSTAEDVRPAVTGHEGFVDEAVVRKLLAGPEESRQQGRSGALALAADEMDFAGWSLAQAPPARRAAPPEIGHKASVDSQDIGHRWWFAGLAGAVTTLLLSGGFLLLFTPTPTADPLTLIRKPDAAAGEPVKSRLPKIAPLWARLARQP